MVHKGRQYPFTDQSGNHVMLTACVVTLAAFNSDTDTGRPSQSEREHVVKDRGTLTIAKICSHLLRILLLRKYAIIAKIRNNEIIAKIRNNCENTK